MIVGLSGQAGSGKDTVADHLVEKYGFVKVALADPIKRAAMEWWDFTYEQLWGPSELRNTPDERYPLTVTEEELEALIEDNRAIYLTPRHALQQIGTEVGRAIDPDVWVRYTIRAAKQLLEAKDCTYHYSTRALFMRNEPVSRAAGVVIPDIRFKNELAAIKKVGKVVRIIRPSRPPLTWADGTVFPESKGLTVEQQQHTSEAEQKEISNNEFDHLINNNGTLKELELKVGSMMDDIKGDDDTPPFKRE